MPDKCIINPEWDCLGLMNAKELEKDLEDFREHNSANHKEFFNRLAVIDKMDAIQAEQNKQIIEKLDQLAADVAELKSKPGKHWDGMVEKIISVLVAAIVGFMLAKFGM